jgi:hypothetical protein
LKFLVPPLKFLVPLLKFLVLTNKNSFSPRPLERTSLLYSSNESFPINSSKPNSSSWTIIN